MGLSGFPIFVGGGALLKMWVPVLHLQNSKSEGGPGIQLTTYAASSDVALGS